MRLFKRPELLLACLLWLLPAWFAPALADAPQALDHIVAVVNDDVITRLELSQRYDEVVQALTQKGTPLPPRDVLEKQLLERMITERALQQHALGTGIRVDPAQVDRTLQRIAAQNKMDVPELEATLKKEGQSVARFRDNIRNEILIGRARERDVDNKITVSDAEIEGYLQTQAQQGADTEYNYSQILISVPENASPEQIKQRRARAQDVLDALAKGGDFAQLSATYSDAQDALQGGNSGWRPSGQIATLFLAALKKLQPGEVAPLLRSGNGFHILKLIDKRGEGVATSVTQTHVRHILIKTNELTSEADAKSRLLQLKERLDNGASFAELARLHSDDGSASKGGDLGWVNPGDTVPEFEKAMDALKPGEISGPVQTPFGWHLIEVLGRRTQDVTQERQKLAARNAIRERKADEAYQDWVRQIRDSAYVELRPID
jgi:peptidyl-prolyl cis-trans isomerase SurA